LRRSNASRQPGGRSKGARHILTLKKHKKSYALQGYKVFFSTKLARQYEPIVYAGECRSGDPEALYYRILKNPKNKLCIQYFYYWKHQNCPPASHNYDYEPIFIYLKFNDPKPYLIVNGGFALGYGCNFHKNEVRPRKGKRDSDIRRVTTNLSPYPFYPFGKDGNVKYSACVKTYPMDSGEDLRFKGGDSNQPLFGIRACSNVFSGAQDDLHGHTFNPRLKRLTDRVLSKWYLHHYENTSDMPFGHDIADPFAPPYIKFHKPSKEEVERLRKLKR
jgi:hypothetical protein